MLANCDPTGVFDIHPRVIAAATGKSLEIVGQAIALLENPDDGTRTSGSDGKRIVRLDDHRSWGWLIVNYLKYRTLHDAETLRAMNRDRVARHRVVRKGPVMPGNAGNEAVMLRNAGNAKEKEKEKKKNTKDKDLSAAPTCVPLEIELQGTKRGTPAAKLSAKDTLPEGELTAAQVFEQIFWPEYPRKVAKAAARSAWDRLKLKDTDDSTMAAIMGGLRRDVKGEWRGREMEKVPHASTWLNQRRWEG